MGITLPSAATDRRSRRRGVGLGDSTPSLLETAAGSGERVDLALLVFAARAQERERHELCTAAAAATSPGDLAKVASDAEDARDAKRAASRKWAAGIATSAASIGAYLSTTVVGAAVGGWIVAASAVAYAAFEGVLQLQDWLEEDNDGPEWQRRATDAVGWFHSVGLPFPRFHKPRHGTVRTYAVELERAREACENMPPADVRAAIFRVGDAFKRDSDTDVTVQAALLVGGENGRAWFHTRLIGAEETNNLGAVVSNRENMDLLTAAIGLTTAREFDLPAVHEQAIVDAAAIGWDNGASRAMTSAFPHPGAVALGTARLFAEAAAAEWRAKLDANPAASIIFGPRGVLAPTGAAATKMAFLVSSAKPVSSSSGGGATTRDAAELKPPAPATPPGQLSPTAKTVVVTAAVGAGVSLFFTTAGTVIRRALFGF